MNKEQFARCPFCGRSDTLTIDKASDAFADTESYSVICDASKPDGPGGCGGCGGYFPSEDEAVAAWNRRAEVERLAAQAGTQAVMPAPSYPKETIDLLVHDITGRDEAADAIEDLKHARYMLAGKTILDVLNEAHDAAHPPAKAEPADAYERTTQPSLAAAYEAHQKNGLEWAVNSWNLEVKDRPLINVHRRSLDDCWRQVVHYFGGNPDELIGPSHDALMDAEPKRNGRPISWGAETTQPAPAPGSMAALDFACYLIDHCELEVVTEEAVQRWLGKALNAPQYTAQPASAPVGEYPALPKPARQGPWPGDPAYFIERQMHAYLDADRAQRPAREVRLLTLEEMLDALVEGLNAKTRMDPREILQCKFAEVNGLTIKEQS